MENNGKQKPKKDWKKKGLGWVPDYPDIRDYKLDHENINAKGRFKREEVTGNIEALADNLIEALKILEKTPEIREKLGSLSDGIERQILGDIRFRIVRFHKLLREEIKEPEQYNYIKF